MQGASPSKLQQRDSDDAVPSTRGGDIEVTLNAVIVSVLGKTPYVLCVSGGSERGMAALPSGPFDPSIHRTFELGLRAFVREQTALQLGHVEQLYTFGDRGRYASAIDGEKHVVSVGYLALTRQTPESDALLKAQGAIWRPWYDFFPWEDWRGGKPPILQQELAPAIKALCAQAGSGGDTLARLSRKERFQLSFGDGPIRWDEERVLDRYEFLYGIGLVVEAIRDGRPAPDLPEPQALRPHSTGDGMVFDHRRILATALSRLRGKLKYRPVVFELMAEQFTLTDLQRTVEAIGGQHVHKQNFRRLVESAKLVEQTGQTSTTTGGRPAALYRFRREILTERPAPGLRIGRM
ncbi:NUDIX hydrolase [Polycladidibacter hongkongensis]|uniref:NUDIX hydrolase n=1 Tax=Polycladidibacter hongkongensis TaxID=1647556 RepID=UPI000B124EF1|nr:NAD regulator [Pseudovibrio hongkongensis]